jgi:hypothetical protein
VQVEMVELREIEAQLVLTQYFQALHLRAVVVLELIQVITLLLLVYLVALVEVVRL